MIARALSLPFSRPVAVLSLVAGVLLAVYTALMIAAILFAALQTQLAQNLQNTQTKVGELEETYYADVAQLDATDPLALGYVKPSDTIYVSQSPLQGLSFAK